MNELSEKVEACLEQIEQYISSDVDISKELIKAKESFTHAFGVVKKDSLEEYSNLMNFFLSWFIFDHQLETYKSSLYELFMDCHKDSIPLYNDLYPNEHSLFLLLKKKKNSCLVQDIFTRNKFLIENEELLGIDKGSLFETRLFSVHEGACFGNFFFIHPERVKKKILKHIKKHKWKREQKNSFLLDLKKFHFKWTHYKYIDVESLYVF